MASDVKPREAPALEPVVVGLARALDLPLEAVWVEGVARQLEITLAMADLVATVELDDEAPSASVYRL